MANRMGIPGRHGGLWAIIGAPEKEPYLYLSLFLFREYPESCLVWSLANYWSSILMGLVLQRSNYPMGCIKKFL